jgi:hypothetical protein
MQQLLSNNNSHLECYDCASKRNVDVIARTHQGFWRTICLNCATKPEYSDWYWRCTNNNCVRPIIADNYFYCYTHHAMYLEWLNKIE